MPIKNLGGRRGGIVGSFPSLKNQKSVYYESTIERDMLFFLEFNQSVVSYQSQPFTIESELNEKIHHYTPDFVAYTTSRNQLIECKPAELINHEHTRQQVDIGSCWCEEHDYDFYLVTDIDLRTGHRLANIKLLWRYARLGVPYILIEHIRSLLHKEPHGLEFVHVVTKLKQQLS